MLRDVPLKRGLNLIVGKSSFDLSLSNDPMAMAGHSVGKTTFCRLLRYCLGEERFATEAGEARIRSSLPQSWVGAEIEIDSAPWAVLRPLGAKGTASAQEDASIEELIAATEKSASFYEYRQELGKLLPPHVNHPEMPYKWEHLLAWLSRDQECRLRKFEVWRDSDSQSGTSGFRKPKEYPVHLVRGMLDLLVPEESEWNQNHSELVQRRKQLEEAQRIASQEADYAYREASIGLAEFIGEFSDTRNESQLSFNSPSMLADNRKSALCDERKDLEKLLAEAEEKLFDEKRYVASALEQKNYISAMLVATPPPVQSVSPQPISETEKNKQKLVALNAKIKETVDCPLANYRLLSECTHLNEYIEDLKRVSPIIQLGAALQAKALEKETPKERQRLQAIIQKANESEAALEAAQSRVESCEKERNGILNQIISLDKELDRLTRAMQSFSQAETFSAGGKQGTDLQKRKEDLERIDSEIYYAKNQLDFYRSQSVQRDEGLQKLFDALVKRVLKANYSGAVVSSADDFCPQILQGSINSGAAVESLSFVLLDIAATLGAANGVGSHPGFLLHDSPREADLSIGPYHSLLTELAAITEETGGESSAPFQYIVTTTTEPPEELGHFVRLPLAAHPESELLFRQQLGEKPTLFEA